jgi:hypothetical protein
MDFGFMALFDYAWQSQLLDPDCDQANPWGCPAVPNRNS